MVWPFSQVEKYLARQSVSFNWTVDEQNITFNWTELSHSRAQSLQNSVTPELSHSMFFFDNLQSQLCLSFAVLILLESQLQSQQKYGIGWNSVSDIGLIVMKYHPFK